MHSLILFDIDATLITTAGCGMYAMLDAGRDLFSPSFSTSGVDFAGRLDPLLIREFFQINNIPHTPANVTAYRAAYAKHLHLRLQSTPRKEPLPGVINLIHRLRASPHITLGLLTGNYPDTGSMKLKACNVDPTWFEIAAWGDDSPHDPPDRAHLPLIAISRYREKFQRPIEPHRVTIIGDTPHDIRCARACGCRVIAVATGRHSHTYLASLNPDRTEHTLADTNALHTWLTATDR